jgi:hypothetical protein
MSSLLDDRQPGMMADTTLDGRYTGIGYSQSGNADTLMGPPQNAPTMDCLVRAAANQGLSDAALESNPATSPGSPLASLAHDWSKLPNVSLAMAETESS